MIATMTTAAATMQDSPLGPMQDGAIQLFLRWIHVVAGVLWIGLLYFFNWVNATFAPTMDGETKKKVVPELMPRALYFFRWGAAWTWTSGLLLIGLLYYHAKGGALNGYFWADPNPAAAGMEGMTTVLSLVALGLVLVLFMVYDIVAKALQKSPMTALWIWYAVALGFAALLHYWLHASNRAIFIHVGALLGTSMAANVWMRIWPNQKRIISAIKAGQAPDAGWVALAGMRSKHNTYMSVPLLLLMVGVHMNYMIRNVELECAPLIWLTGIFAVGYLATSWIFKTSTGVKGF